MKTKIFIVIAVFAMLIAACAPGAGASTASTDTPAPNPAPSLPASVATVESVEVHILESMPIQVQVVVRGQLPDAGCTTIGSVEQVREGNVIRVTLVTTTDPLALCAQALTPFEHVIELDVSDLPAGSYVVEVHGVEASFELPGRDLPSFQAQLVAALNARDYDQLRSLMGDPFMIAYWLSEGTSNSPDQAVEQLQVNLLSSSAPIVVDESRDLTELLGMDPVTIVGPEVVEVNPLLTSGWGQEGKDEAILFIAKDADGNWYWYGLLFARDGFAAQ
ncbi:MAG TPA: hypothetical protein VK888_09920 [Anaerolineales bacterium]|nr:hypothetical protein [Anaerolineales bacterium]